MTNLNPTQIPSEPDGVMRPHQWLTLTDLKPGMIVAKTAMGMHGTILTVQIPVGSVITVDSITQMAAHSAECVAVYVDGRVRNDEHVMLHQARLNEIFGTKPEGGARQLSDALRRSGPD